MSNPWRNNPVSLRHRLEKLAGQILVLALLAGWTGTAHLNAQDKPKATTLPPDLELVGKRLRELVNT